MKMIYCSLASKDRRKPKKVEERGSNRQIEVDRLGNVCVGFVWGRGHWMGFNEGGGQILGRLLTNFGRIALKRMASGWLRSMNKNHSSQTEIDTSK